MSNYMAIYINVMDGKIAEVYQADDLPSGLDVAGTIPKDKDIEKIQYSLFDVVSLMHFGVKKNPICRIVEHNGRLRIVCT